jgi:putative FmdB family regulatory protein
MPLYEYQCDACGHRFETIQKFSDPPVEVCPKCGGQVQKLQSAPAIQFKGSGWYITDYARKDSSPAGKADAPAKTPEKPDAPAATAPKSDTPAPAKGDSGGTKSGD